MTRFSLLDGELISVEAKGHVTILTMSRPPYNYFNAALIEELLAKLKQQDENEQCRATVLAASGKVFCAGGEFGHGELGSESYIQMARGLYAHAMQLYRIRKPMVAAVQGPAIGAGLGLALVADFRVTCERARFSANFNRLGLHPGFGLTVTLPRLIGSNKAELLLYTGRRINGAEAVDIGLANLLVEAQAVRTAAIELAHEIAQSGPQAVQDTRATFRRNLAEKIIEANQNELDIQIKHMRSDEFLEGVRASAERRLPHF
ncbi:MAG: enoyl-CoA hydratase/isomerase family protein [Pseudomonadales bacterium]